MKIILITAVFCITAQLNAQKKELTNDQYFKNKFDGIVQPLPTFTDWVSNDAFVFAKEGKKYVYNCKTNKTSDYTETAINKGSFTPKPQIVSKDNNLYMRKNVEDVQLTFDKEKEINATLSPDTKYVAYTKNNNLFTFNLESMKETKLTTDGSDVILNGYLSWIYMEEIIGRQSNYRGFWWSPDSKSIAFFRSNDSQVPTFTITDADNQHGYIEVQRYPKSGDKNPEVKIGIISPDGGSTNWANFDEKQDQYFGQPNWRPDGKAIWVNWMNRGNDKLIIYEVNITDGSKKELYKEEQKTWIDLDDNDRITFLEAGKGFLMTSDKTGWKQIYWHDMNGKLVNPVTQGQFTVISIDHIDMKKNLVYFIARSKENSARRDYYSVQLNGKNLKRLTFGEYNHSVRLSPDGSYIVTTFNNTATPSSLAVVNTKTGKNNVLATAKAGDFDNYTIAKTELIRVKSDDGKYDLPLRITWPTNYDQSKKYPVLISIYGGPDAGTVWDTWSLTGNQQWYAKEGLIQVAMDHRASGHFGKEGVNYMHRNLGTWEMVDYITMVKWLINNAGADPKRVCITGFSYGGYVSSLALVKGEGYFTHAMAGGSVTDWLLYDSHYTEKLMDTPAENPDGYNKSSVVKNASSFKGVLQLVHGIIDDNVHLQNSVQLLAKLQDYQKDVEYMTYSGGRHGWRNLPARNAHYENLKTKFIYKYLLQKEVPNEILRK